MADIEPGDGWLYRALRWPVRIVAIIVVVPFRLLWELLKLVGRGVARVVEWLARAVAWPFRMLWRYVLEPPLRFVLHWLWEGLKLLGRGLELLLRSPLRWIGRGLLWLLRGLGRLVELTLPVWRLVGRGLAAVGRGLKLVLVRPLRWAWTATKALWRAAAVPCAWVWRYVLRPVGRGIGAAFRVASVPLRWAGRLVGSVFRAVGGVLRQAGRDVRRAFGFRRNG